MDKTAPRTLRFNFTVSLLDGGFFGLALGFASFTTILPLFVSTLTDSAILIALIPAMHAMGWQLPQLLTADRVAQLRRYKPMVVLMTLHERVPFLAMALVAWFAASLGRELTLLVTFAVLLWQGLGGGFTATAWQSMIGKIIPARSRGLFFGAQSGMANLFMAGSALVAGKVLDEIAGPLDFTLCFLLAGGAMAVSWGFLALTREADAPPARAAVLSRREFWGGVGAVLQRDANFRRYIVARMLAMLATFAFSYYMVYVVKRFNIDDSVAGGLTGGLTAALTIAHVVANPVMGWVSDRLGHRRVMAFGALCATASALVAWQAPSFEWFYLVVVLAGLANVAVWTVGLAMTLEFGTEAERPVYIGLTNSLVAPVTLLLPVAGGWLADLAGYEAAFIASAIGGLLTALLLEVGVQNPRHMPRAESLLPLPSAPDAQERVSAD